MISVGVRVRVSQSLRAPDGGLRIFSENEAKLDYGNSGKRYWCVHYRMPHICRCYYQFSNPKRVLLGRIGMDNLCGNTNNIIEGFFDIPTPSRDMGPLTAEPRGPWGAKIFFFNFSHFLYSRTCPGVSPSLKTTFLPLMLNCLFAAGREKGTFLLKTSEFYS